MVSEEGEYRYVRNPSKDTFGGSEQTCGVYMVAKADQVIEVDFEYIDVDCDGGGLVTFFDGWEMNREVFPSREDHKIPFRRRFTEMCEQKTNLPTKLRWERQKKFVNKETCQKHLSLFMIISLH